MEDMNSVTEEGTVTRLGYGGTAFVKAVKNSACASCAARNSCNPMETGKEMEVEAINTAGAGVGDKVKIELRASSLVKLSLLMYMFPLISMIVGIFVGREAANFFHIDEAISCALVGFLFLFVAFMLARTKAKKMEKESRYQPEISKILEKYKG